MTVTHYIAEFTDADGKQFVGEVFWDKYHQRQLQVTICPRLDEHMLDYPIWKSSGIYRIQNRAEMEKMVTKLESKASKLGLSLESERVTPFAPKK